MSRIANCVMEYPTYHSLYRALMVEIYYKNTIVQLKILCESMWKIKERQCLHTKVSPIAA